MPEDRWCGRQVYAIGPDKRRIHWLCAGLTPPRSSPRSICHLAHNEGTAMKTLLSLAVALSLSMSAAAHAGSLVDVSVIDRDSGATLPTYSHDGKLYVAGTPGHRYGVRIVNRTGARVLTVLSVDGVNAITGENADPNQSGYVLGAYDSTEVDGWRKNMSEIAEFNFTNLGDSYAARTGRANNVGVIGVAVFREKPHYTWRERDEKIAREAPLPSPAADAAGYARKDAAPPPVAAQAPASAAGAMAKSAAADTSAYNGVAEARRAKPEESLGTGHGEREYSSATYTAFERDGSRPSEVDSIWYDSQRNLVARGVIPSPRPIAREPQPFPNVFVPDPS